MPVRVESVRLSERANAVSRGVIGPDGHVFEPAVLTNGRPELEHQAVQIVSGWIFSPGVCDGEPVPVDAQLVVHFPLL
jgi:hypothetical protein